MKKLRERINDIDAAMQNLFLERMQVVKEVALFKKENNLPVLDALREKEIIEKNVKRIDHVELVDFYEEFYKKVIDISKKYQNNIIGE